MLEKNLGRDIAKYFDGGYTMENSSGQKPIRHTYQARAIIDQLTVAYLNNRAPTFDVTLEEMH